MAPPVTESHNLPLPIYIYILHVLFPSTIDSIEQDKRGVIKEMKR